MKHCETCQTEIARNPDQPDAGYAPRRFCSLECGGDLSMICQQCGCQTDIASHSRARRRKHCCEECRNKLKKRKHVPQVPLAFAFITGRIMPPYQDGLA